MTLPSTSNNTLFGEQLLQLALAGSLPTAGFSNSPHAGSIITTVSLGDCGRLLTPGQQSGQQAAAILAAAETAMDCARLDAALLLCCLSPTAGMPRDAAAAAHPSAAAGLKAAALKAAKGNSSSSSTAQQGAGSCFQDMGGQQGPASSRLSARAS
jgi:hypothetical protein